MHERNTFSLGTDKWHSCVRDIKEYVNAARDGGQKGCIILVSNAHKVKLREFQENEMKYNISKWQFVEEVA